jgi:hypothetical protein
MTARPARRRVRGRVAGSMLAALVLAVTLAGCSASESPASSGGVAEDRAAAPGGFGGQGGEVAEGAPPAAEPPKDASEQQQTVKAEERTLIYTGQIYVKVDDVGAKADQAAGIATSLGGTIGGDQRALNGDQSSAQIVLRVPSDKFDEALNQLARLGTEESRSKQTEDVTEQVVDLEARLATQRASVDRVRALLAQATTIGEVVSIESELTRREADLASLEQRRERLAGLVALSTITAYLHGPDAEVVPDEPDTGFLAGLKSGWRAFLESVKILLTVAGWLLPWAIAIFVPIWLLIWFLRRRRPARATIPAAPAPPPSDS